MGDTGLETVGGGALGREAPCLLGFDALRLAGVCSEWNLRRRAGARIIPPLGPAPDGSDVSHTIRYMLTVAEAASRLGQDRETIRRWVRSGRLRAQLVAAGTLSNYPPCEPSRTNCFRWQNYRPSGRSTTTDRQH